MTVRNRPARLAYYSEQHGAWVLPLTQGKEALIDADDILEVTKNSWSAYHAAFGWIAMCPQNGRTGRGSKYLHRFVLGADGGANAIPRDGDFLNCRKANLRWDTPLYTMPHGIEVMAQVAPNPKCPYWRVYVHAHPLILGAETPVGTVLAKRSRVFLASVLGRALKRSEHVHHKNHDTEDDSPENLEVMTAAQHNRHHKTGSHRSEDVKRRISDTLKRAYREGLRQITGAAKTQMGG